MSWFFGRRKPQGVQPSSLELGDGDHPSPGLEVLWTTLRQSPPRAILDLGASSTENLRFLSTFTDNLAIIDLFRGAREAEGTRASVFSFDTEALESLPAAGEKFDVVLLWDLLHYFDRATSRVFEDRLVELCHPRAVLHLLAANHAEVPHTPMRFKLQEPDSLHYGVPVGERVSGANLTTREVEIRLARFTPWRLFQLRNGLQEFLFRFDPTEGEQLPEVPQAIRRSHTPRPTDRPAVTSSRPSRSDASAPTIVSSEPVVSSVAALDVAALDIAASDIAASDVVPSEPPVLETSAPDSSAPAPPGSAPEAELPNAEEALPTAEPEPGAGDSRSEDGETSQHSSRRRRRKRVKGRRGR